MGGVSVQLDHEPALAPQVVDLELAAAQSDAGIDLGRWEAGVLQEARKPILELATGYPGAESPAARAALIAPMPGRRG
jgi:hypothetical protein